MREGINQVENWGFRFSVEKTKVTFFTRNKLKECNLKLYGSVLERVERFCFLGVHFDQRLTWREHIINKEWMQIFTDGSKDPHTDATGAAIPVPSVRFGCSKRTSECFCC